MASSVLGECLDLVLEARFGEAHAHVSAAREIAATAGERSRLAAVAAFAAALEARHAFSRHWAGLARTEADDAASRSYATAAEIFTSCLAPPGEGVTPVGELVLDPGWTDEDRCILGYLVIEAAMSSGRLVD